MYKKKECIMQNNEISNEINLSEKEHEFLCKKFGFNKLREQQIQTIACVKSGRDCLLVSRTASGKTEAVIGAKLLAPESGIILQIEPLCVLQTNMHERLFKLINKTAILNSTISTEEYDNILARIKSGHIQCLITTPEQLEKSDVLDALNNIVVDYLILDEAHCLIDWNDFRPAYSHIGSFIKQLNHRPIIIGCSATLTENSVNKVIKSLNMVEPLIIKSSIDRPEIKQNVIKIDTDIHPSNIDLINKERYSRLTEILKKYGNKKDISIVYCTTIKQAKLTEKYLKRKKFKNVFLFHSKLSDKKKDDIYNKFNQNETRIIVATSAFGMGVDRPNIRLVVHLSMPFSIEDYWQKSGRAGRDGKKSYSFVLWHKSDFNKNLFIIKDTKSKKRQLKDIKNFLESKECYSIQIRKYFGQKAGKKCKNCSNCN